MYHYRAPLGIAESGRMESGEYATDVSAMLPEAGLPLLRLLLQLGDLVIRESPAERFSILRNKGEHLTYSSVR